MKLSFAPLYCLMLFLPLTLFAQLKGRVTDTSGESLPFATIYVQGTTIGTTSNAKGEFSLDLEKG